MTKRIIAFLLMMVLLMDSGKVMAVSSIKGSSGEVRLLSAGNRTSEKTGRAFSMSENHGAAITADGELNCWGGNYYGAVGDGSTNDQLTPKRVLGNVTSVGTDKDFTAALTKDGKLYCWGNNDFGAVGNGTTQKQLTPLNVLDNVTAVEMSNSGGDNGGHTTRVAAITKGRELYCWGYNGDGAIGSGTTKSQLTPKKVLSNVASVVMSKSNTAAVTKDGKLFCWGNGEYGQIGNGATENQLKPKRILDNVANVVLGNYNVAAITRDGELFCWGDNEYGQIGNGRKKDQLTPKKVLDGVISVKLSEYNTAAITKDGALYCWGSNESGVVGSGTENDQLTPKKILNNVKAVELSEYNVAAITGDGELFCWGDNLCGQAGNGTEDDQLTPLKVLDNVVAVDLSKNNMMAAAQNGDLFCWGDSECGIAGNGELPDMENQLMPQKLLENVAAMSLDEYGAAAVTKDGKLFCWGLNDFGRLGNGTKDLQKRPAKILENVMTGTGVPSTGKDDPSKSDEIDLAIYKADRCLKSGMPSYKAVKSMKEMEYPSQVIVKALNKDRGSFEKQVLAWKAVHFKPSNAIDGKLDEKGYYEAIILSIFVTQIESKSFVMDIFKKANSEANTVLGNVKKWAEQSDALEAGKISTNQILTTISVEDQKAIREHCAGLFKKNHPLLNEDSNFTDAVDTAFSASTTVIEAVQRMCSYVQLCDLSLQQKAVLQKMHELCPSLNWAFKAALAEVVESMKGFDDGIKAAITNAMLEQGNEVMGVMLDEGWKKVIALNPYAAAFKAGADIGAFVGDTVCNTLFSTNKTIEQYIKMKCLGEFNQILLQAESALKKSYQQKKDSQNAKNYLESVETIFAAASISCDYAKDYGDVIYKDAAVGRLVKSAEDAESYALKIERIKQDYSNIHTTVADDYLAGLENDYPEIYKSIMKERAEEKAEHPSKNLLEEIGIAASRTSYDRYKEKSKITVKFPNNKKPSAYSKSSCMSSNPKVAEVGKNGNITVKKKGISIITARVYLKDGAYKQVKFKVTVGGKKVTVSYELATIVE